MAYGGLRGAVAYGLVVSLPTDHIPLETKKLFVTTIEMVVLFTVFVQVKHTHTYRESIIHYEYCLLS
jgi:NhaP-type Na+/H+ or K+/H+ antiporter